MEDHLVLRIIDIIRETEDTATFVFENSQNKAISYEPGQFLTFIFDFQGHQIRRSYSISSAPGVDKALSVTVKKVQNGEISRYLVNNARVGDLLHCLPPAGRFTINSISDIQRDIFLFGAGSGIVPLFSIMKAILHHEKESQLHLIYSNRNEDSIIFSEQIADLQAKYPTRLTCLHILSNPVGSIPASMHAHLNNFLVEELVSQRIAFPKQLAEFYICGPFGYMRMVKIMLQVSGFKSAQIHKENFITESAISEIQLPVGNVEAQVKINFRGSESYFFVPTGTSVLKAALANGIQIPYSCQGGICASCVVKCESGKVEMTTNEVLTPDEIDENYVLTCVGYPVTPILEIRL